MTQPSHPPKDPLARIFAYRAIDLRDRFPQPLESCSASLGLEDDAIALSKGLEAVAASGIADRETPR